MIEAEFKPNLEKLRKLQQQSGSIIIGGKGCPRRKKKVIHKSAGTDDKKLQSALKKLAMNGIQGIEEVNMFKEGSEIIVFQNPKVQANVSSNIFAISGPSEIKTMQEMLPQLIQQFGFGGALNSMNQADLFNLKESIKTDLDDAKEDEEVPELVEDFDEASKNEV